MSKKKAYYVSAFTLLLVAAGIWIGPLLGVIPFEPFDMTPLLTFAIASTLGLIFLLLALVQKDRQQAGAIWDLSHRSINPILPLAMGTLIILAIRYGHLLGLDLFGVKTILFTGAVLLLVYGAIGFLRKLI